MADSGHSDGGHADAKKIKTGGKGHGGHDSASGDSDDPDGRKANAIQRLEQRLANMSKQLTRWLPLAAKLISDAIYLRIVHRFLGVLTTSVAVAIGVQAAFHVGPGFTAPHVIALTALTAISALDTVAALLGIVTFIVGAAIHGASFTVGDMRLAIGLILFSVAPAMLSTGFRSIRRTACSNIHDWLERAWDVVLVPVLGSWALYGLAGLMDTLAGREVGIQSHMHLLIPTLAVALVVRIALEEYVAQYRPEYMKAAAAAKPGEPSAMQKHISLIIRTALFGFLMIALIGNNWALYVGLGFTALPWFAGLWKHKFPNSPLLYQVLPADLLLLVVGLLSPMLIQMALPGSLKERHLWLFIAATGVSALMSILGYVGRDPKPGGVRWYMKPNLRPVYWLWTIMSFVFFIQVAHIGELLK
jgi:hypothetical protein